MEHSLHGWVAYLIIPLFALANAGVVITGGDNSYIYTGTGIDTGTNTNSQSFLQN